MPQVAFTLQHGRVADLPIIWGRESVRASRASDRNGVISLLTEWCGEGVEWCGVVWCGVVRGWCGVVWCDVVRSGVV